MAEKSLNEDGLGSDEYSSLAYYKEATSLLVGKVSNNLELSKVSDEFEIDQLVREHKEADAKISTLLKQIEEETRLSSELDRQIQAKAQQQSRTIARKQRTGDIIKVLKEEVERTKRYSALTEAEMKDLRKKFKIYSKCKDELEENKNKVAKLEVNIQKVQEENDANPYEVDENLIKENEILKKEREEKLKKLEEKRLKSKNLKILNDRNYTFNRQLCKVQERYCDLMKTLVDKTKQIGSIEETMKLENDEMEKNYSQIVEKSNALRADVRKLTDSNGEKKLRIEDLKQTNLALETEIEQMKLKNEQFERELKNKLEIEKENFKVADVKFVNLSEELVQLKDTLQIKSQQKLEVDQCAVQILKTTTECAKLEIEVVNAQHKLDAIVEQVTFKQTKLESLRSEKSNLNKGITEMTEYVDNSSEIWKKQLDDVNIQFNENRKELAKQVEFIKASMELLQFKLDSQKNELANVNAQKQDVETEMKFDKKRLEAQLDCVKLWTDKLNKERIEYNEALEKYNELLKKDEVISPNGDASNTPRFLENFTHDEPDTRLSGILKDPRSPKRSSTPTKNVRFQGLSSSSESEKAFNVELEESLKSLV